jgi:transcriptional regulator with XRE-family HTH domain
MEELPSLIGMNLKRLRKERHFTLETLSQATGVSTSMLCDIEHGVTNPTITVVWKIADGLKVPLTDLIKEEKPIATVVRRGEAPLQLDGEGFKIYSHHAFDAQKRMEIFSKELEPGAMFESNGHRKGMEEYLLICEGSLLLKVGDDEFELFTGDSIRFVANVKHSYHNPLDVPMRCYTIFYYGEEDI